MKIINSKETKKSLTSMVSLVLTVPSINGVPSPDSPYFFSSGTLPRELPVVSVLGYPTYGMKSRPHRQTLGIESSNDASQLVKIQFN